MKFKTTAIAMAVAGTVAAPIAVQAGADEIYASARVGLWNVSEGDSSDAEVRSFSSRFGARGETDLGNGLIGFGRYEWDVDLDNNTDRSVDAKTGAVTSGNGSSIDLRHRYVGVKGDFGSVLVGQTYQTFYNFVVGPTDIPWWHSGYAMVAYVGRTDDAITYAGGSDAFAFGATAYFTNDAGEQNSPNAWEGGASFTFGNDMVLGGAVQGTQAPSNSRGTQIGNDNDKTVFGVALSGISFGDFGLGIGAQAQDDDTSFLVDATYSNAYVHIEAEQLDSDSPTNTNTDDDDQDRVSYTLGYTQSLGRKTTMYYELNYIDNDSGNTKRDRTAVMAVLKYDII
jgi:predicted porin